MFKRIDRLRVYARKDVNIRCFVTARRRTDGMWSSVRFSINAAADHGKNWTRAKKKRAQSDEAVWPIYCRVHRRSFFFFFAFPACPPRLIRDRGRDQDTIVHVDLTNWPRGFDASKLKNFFPFFFFKILIAIYHSHYYHLFVFLLFIAINRFIINVFR